MALHLRRVTLGRLGAHHATPVPGVTEAFRLTDWTFRSGVTGSLTGGLLRTSATATSRANRYTRIAARADMMVQTVAQARSVGSSLGPGTRVSAADVAGVAVDWLQHTISTGFSGPRAMVERSGSATIQSNNSGNSDEGVPYRISAKVHGTECATYFHSDNDERALSGLVNVAAGWAALFHSSGSAATNDYSEFYVMASHILTVRGPNTTWRARIKDAGGTVLAFADAVAGVAEIDLFAARIVFPLATRLEIYDVAGAAVLISFDPGARLWGGDEWIYEDTDPPAPVYPLERTALGRLAAFSSAPIAGASVAFDLADWTADTGITLSLSGGALRLTAAASQIARKARLTLLADRENAFIQGVASATAAAAPATTAALIARANAGLWSGAATMVWFDIPVSQSFPIRAYEWANADIGSDQVGGNFNFTLPHRLNLSVKGTALRGYMHASAQPRARTLTTVNGAGAVGVWYSRGSAGSTDYSEFYAMTDHLITVTGPTAPNWRAALVDAAGDVLAYADAVAGSASINCDDTLSRVVFPLAVRLDIIDMDDPLHPLLATATPAETLWGGDAWEWELAGDIGPGLLEFGATFTAGLEVENPEPEYASCAVVLEVYEPDGVTVAFLVTTDPASEQPLLMPPSNYGAREIDPVGGAATLGTVDVTIVDRAIIPGDQDGGFVTARLDTIFGRRCRLRRFVSPSVGFFVIADGPASAPRMSADYASFTFAIRDTRETERRLRPFSTGGTLGLVPFGPIQDWGEDPLGGPLLDAVVPLIGTTLIQFNSTAGEFVGIVQFLDYSTPGAFPGGFEIAAASVVSEAALERFKAAGFGARAGFPQADVLWRFVGETVWNVARPSVPELYADNAIAGTIAGQLEGSTEQVLGLNSVYLFWADAIPAGMPDEDGLEVEVIIRHRGAPSDELPHYYEGNLGALLAALYDRSLERAPDLGGDLYDPLGMDTPPTTYFGGGVRVDAAALAAIDTPVLLRQTEPVDNGREWAEESLYSPSGYIPSLDSDGRISPVSRARPTIVTGPTITAAISEPTSEWNAGERVVTAVRYTWLRYFKPTLPLLTETEADGLAVREVTLEFRDPAAEERHGEQLEEFDASAFGAIGDGSGNAQAGIPEVPAVLGSAARYEVLERYRDGAQAIVINVRRSEVPGLRDGDFVAIALAWLPNFATGRRGMAIGAAQVLSIENLGCAWMTLLIEEVPVAAPPGYFTDLEKIEDTPDPGFFTDLEMVSDEEGGS